MTFSESVLKFLDSNGMQAAQAEQVLEMLVNDRGQESMKGRWDGDVSEYPPVMEKLILLSVKHFAIEWIDANLPLAWYRPMFE